MITFCCCETRLGRLGDDCGINSGSLQKTAKKVKRKYYSGLYCVFPQSKNDSSELSSMTEGSPPLPTSARGPEQRTSGDISAALAFSQRLQCTECVQCALMEDAVQRLEASRREAGLKLRSYEAQIRSLQQASSYIYISQNTL
ncbi:hypothetical protein HPB49_019712 [Dermacentor silvarum]|uniref:Uncharacterized protein n=1 Tax=Dermacentor silvarum TaxID=543639 RepID=A0ACB8DFR5_DERSI|nr:hypothetical protein HPB49_019712 [Dermacentor silvarum]